MNLTEMGFEQANEYYFDTIKVKVEDAAAVKKTSRSTKHQFHYYDDKSCRYFT